MSFEAFLKAAQKQPSSSRSPFVEGKCRNTTVDGVYFTVPSWDEGRHVFGPAPWASDIAPGDKVLVAFPSEGIDDTWVVAANPPAAVVSAADYTADQAAQDSRLDDVEAVAAAAAVAAALPNRFTGEFIMGGFTSAPAGTLLLNGVTIIGGATTYAALAAMFPSWVSGANLTPPLADGATFLPSASAAGVVSGSMSRTLTAAQMPTHNHTSPVHSHTTVSHDHTNNHDHASFDTASGGTHLHLVRFLTTSTGSGSNADLARPGTFSYSNTANINDGGTASGGHVHSIDVPSFTGNTGSAAPSTNNNAAANTGDAGSGNSVDITPKNLTVKVAVVY